MKKTIDMLREEVVAAGRAGFLNGVVIRPHTIQFECEQLTKLPILLAYIRRTFPDVKEILRTGTQNECIVLYHKTWLGYDVI